MEFLTCPQSHSVLRTFMSLYWALLLAIVDHQLCLGHGLNTLARVSGSRVKECLHTCLALLVGEFSAFDDDFHETGVRLTCQQYNQNSYGRNINRKLSADIGVREKEPAHPFLLNQNHYDFVQEFGDFLICKQPLLVVFIPM